MILGSALRLSEQTGYRDKKRTVNVCFKRLKNFLQSQLGKKKTKNYVI